MTYSGLAYPVAAWNQNLTLEQAFQSSCVWYFRQVIDQVGRQAVAEQLAALPTATRTSPNGRAAARIRARSSMVFGLTPP